MVSALAAPFSPRTSALIAKMGQPRWLMSASGH